jgi:hypothetical protein
MFESEDEGVGIADRPWWRVAAYAVRTSAAFQSVEPAGRVPISAITESSLDDPCTVSFTKDRRVDSSDESVASAAHRVSTSIQAGVSR